MKRFKLVCVNKEGSFTIREDEFAKVIEGRKKNQPTVFMEGVVLNWNMVAVLVPDKERNADLAEARKMNYKLEEPSPFASLMANKMSMIKDKN